MRASQLFVQIVLLLAEGASANVVYTHSNGETFAISQCSKLSLESSILFFNKNKKKEWKECRDAADIVCVVSCIVSCYCHATCISASPLH